MNYLDLCLEVVIASHSPLNISETVRDRDLVPKDDNRIGLDCAVFNVPSNTGTTIGNVLSSSKHIQSELTLLADRTNDRAYVTVLCPSVCLLTRYVLWLNGASFDQKLLLTVYRKSLMKIHWYLCLEVV